MMEILQPVMKMEMMSHRLLKLKTEPSPGMHQDLPVNTTLLLLLRSGET
jgi:hypothetical protein